MDFLNTFSKKIKKKYVRVIKKRAWKYDNKKAKLNIKN